MLHLLFKLSKFVPNDVYQSVFNIDYNKLYENGKRIILMDIDNTLIPYDIPIPDQKLVDLFLEIKAIGFEIIFISNNHKMRVGNFAREVGSRYISDAMKPLKKGYKKALKMIKPYGIDQVISIGDQIVTDILGSRRMGIDCFLVKPIKRKTEKWYTKFNRKMENAAIKKLQKHYPDIYLKIEDVIQNEN